MRQDIKKLWKYIKSKFIEESVEVEHRRKHVLTDSGYCERCGMKMEFFWRSNCL